MYVKWRELKLHSIKINEKNKVGRESGGVYSVLVGKTKGKCPLGRTRIRWEDNIKMDLQ
jgi:hypothetical protein